MGVFTSPVTLCLDDREYAYPVGEVAYPDVPGRIGKAPRVPCPNIGPDF